MRNRIWPSLYMILIWFYRNTSCICQITMQSCYQFGIIERFNLSFISASAGKTDEKIIRIRQVWPFGTEKSGGFEETLSRSRHKQSSSSQCWDIFYGLARVSDDGRGNSGISHPSQNIGCTLRQPSDSFGCNSGRDGEDNGIHIQTRVVG